MDKVDVLAETFADDGFCHFEGIMEDQDILDWKAHALSSFEEVNHMISESGANFGIGIKNGFKEIVQRHQSRFEMPYGADHKKFDVVLENQPLMALVKKVLQSDDVVVANRSFVISLPGAEAQGWHSDGPHVSVNEYLPCHVLNVFVPLVDVDDSNGPTEFRPGSQKYTNNLAKGMLLALAKKRNKPNQAPHIKAGSVLLFDYRVLHRGGPNKSDAARPVLVFTFAKNWYRDTLNFPARSILSIVNEQKESVREELPECAAIESSEKESSS